MLEMLKLNVRVSDMFMGDLGAQIAACTVGARRLGEVAQRYGYHHLRALFAELLDRSEALGDFRKRSYCVRVGMLQ